MRLRIGLLLALWACAIGQIFIDSPWLRQLTSLALAGYLILALRCARRETLGLAILLSGLTVFVLGADLATLFDGLTRALIFVALLPTLQLTRATARRLPAIQESQRCFNNLPEQWRDIGILFGAQAFGSVLNTGAFAFMASVLAPDSRPDQRHAAALASLRGMNSAVLWSPFFVGFAVANTYFPQVELWQILPLGLSLVTCSMLIALFMFARPLSLAAVHAALVCLRPIFFHMGCAAVCVVAVSLLSPLSTLQAVLLAMPILCLLQVLQRPGMLRSIGRETYSGLNRMGDDLIIIVAAMVLGTVAESAPLITEQVTPWLAGALPRPLIIATVIVTMTGCGMVGLHPMISATVLMVSLAGPNQQVHDLVLMETMLIGWALASMTSFASLSVLSAGAMYQVAPFQLAFSRNILFAGLFALLAIAILNGLDLLLAR